MEQRIWKRRLLAFLLAVAMLCTTMLPAFASETRPLVYDPAILEQLTEIAGDASKSPEEKLTQLIEMGLITQQDIDEAKQDTVSDAEASAGALRNGMRTLNIHGRKMTLDDIREMLAQPDIDLSQKVNICLLYTSDAADD